MHNFQGQLRKVGESGINTPSKDLFESDFHQDQRHKYERSECSYGGNSNSRAIFNHQRSNINRDSREIYDNNIPVKVKSHERDDYSTFLHMQLIMLQEKAGSVLRLNLTDDANHFFLWSFLLKESDYMSLRNQQKIKVDFGGFPEMLVQHFGFLQNERQAQGNQTYFYCVFDIKKGGQATLTILQSNKFKESPHLALKFKMASDEQIKVYLADKLTKEKQFNEQLRISNSKLEDQLNARMMDLQTTSVKLKILSEERTKELESLSLTEQKKFNDFREKTLSKETQLSEKFENQKKSIQSRFEQTVKQLEDKLNMTQQQLDSQTTKKLELESKLRELTRQLSINQKQLASKVNLYEECRKSLNQRQLQCFNQEKNILELQFKVESQERQLNDKKALINSSKQLRDTANNQKQALEDRINEEKKKYQKLQAQFKQARDELTRAVTVNEQLNEKYKRNKQKIIERTELLKQQDREVDELKKAISDGEKRENSLKRDLQTAQNKILDLEAKNSQLKTNLDEKKKELENQSELMAHLNKQLNDRTSSIRPLIGSTTSPLSIPHSIGRFPLGTSVELQPYQTGTSRLRQSTSPLQKTERVQPQIKKYQPQQTSLPMPGLSQQKDPEDLMPTMTTEVSNRIRPIKYRNPE